ncbi:MAG: hypothetical protein ABJQ71_05955 [Roseibium sp.]
MSDQTADYSPSIKAIFDQLEEIRTSQTNDRNNSSESRRRVYERLNEVSEILHGMALKQAQIDQRMAMMEETYAAAAPTLTKFSKTKQRVVGAGMLGRVLWRIGAALLGAACTLYVWRTEIWAALVKLMAK